MPIFIATRGSALALAQANLILDQCRAAVPAESFELKIIKTTGDKLQTASLTAGDLPKGLFTKEIEEALLSREADLAVHSLKDLPTQLPAGLKLGAVTTREDVRDVLVYRDVEHVMSTANLGAPVNTQRRGYRPALGLAGLPHGATVATSSTRRAAQVREHRPDLNIVEIRGNVGTRLRRIAEQSELDATILAAAGLRRLKMQITPDGKLFGDDVPAGLGATPQPLSEMLPCVGQAAIGLEIRENDPKLDALCAALNHSDTLACVTAERAFLSAMGGGCNLGVAAHATVSGSELQMRVVSYLGERPLRAEGSRSISDATALGAQLASQLRKN